MVVIHCNSDSDFTALMVRVGTTPVVTKFSATWCGHKWMFAGPCRAIAPFFNELSNRYTQLEFADVDVDKCGESKNTYGITAMPTFVVMINGQKMDVLRGADKTALEQLVVKWSQNVPTQHESPIPGQSDLVHFIDESGLECLNEDDDKNLRVMLSGDGPLMSDCDEQLIINIPFGTPVKIHSIYINGPTGKKPKVVKVFTNNSNTLDFDKAQSAQAIQELDFSSDSLQGLKFVKFQNVNSVQLFIKDNCEGGEQTVIESLRLFGQPLRGVTDMHDFKRVSDLLPSFLFGLFLCCWQGGRSIALKRVRKMDVERLMRDLTIEQLEGIQQSLSKEVENKKEELRQMVGRRYRVVLQAANAVKRLGEISDELVTKLQSIKTSISSIDQQPHGTIKLELSNAKRLSTQRFILLNSIMPMVGTANDGLTDVFCLLLAEHFHRSVIVDSNSSIEQNRIINMYGDQLMSTRLQLKGRLDGDLGEMTDWTTVAGQLIAIAFLTQKTVEELLILYLDCRKQTILANLRSSTLIGVIQMMKDTVWCVDQVFGARRGLLSAFNVITTPGWCPELLREYMDDQPHVYARLFASELTKINGAYRGEFVALQAQEVEANSSKWMIELCSKDKETIQEMCSCFERTEQLLDFALAINKVFKTDSPTTVSNSTVYRNLFGDSLLKRWRSLIQSELATSESELLHKIQTVNCNPPPLFHKRAAKFDGLLASGVSQEVHVVVQKFFDQLRNLMHRVGKYVNVGYEENVAILRTNLSDSVLEMLKRLTNQEHHRVLQRQSIDLIAVDGSSGPSNSDPTTISAPALLPSEENQRWLREFRLFLALVQYEPSIISQCMFDDTEKAVEGNRMLRTAAETALWFVRVLNQKQRNCFSHLIDYIVDEAVLDTELSKLPIACSQPIKCLDFVQVPGRIVLDRSTGSAASVPTQLSKQLFNFLFTICRRISHNSYAHLFTRNVSVRVAERLAELLSSTLRACAHQVPKESVFAVQLVLDCRILHQMFPHTNFVEAVEILQSKIDPMEWNLLDGPLGKNARSAVKRCAMLFGQIQLDAAFSAVRNDESKEQKEDTEVKDDTEMPLTDIMPRLEGVPRLSAIPRLTKIKDDEKAQRTRQQQLAANESKRADGKNWNFPVDGFLGYFMQGKHN
ncbi:putative thioredoxin [Aphelenchoides besseyi]|nr:putative thioredoxin [Aphelenchoides besseyi]